MIQARVTVAHNAATWIDHEYVILSCDVGYHQKCWELLPRELPWFQFKEDRL